MKNDETIWQIHDERISYLKDVLFFLFDTQNIVPMSLCFLIESDRRLLKFEKQAPNHCKLNRQKMWNKNRIQIA